MAEQSTVTFSGLPVSGGAIGANDGQATALNQLVADYNKQVPLSKISADNAYTLFATTATGYSGTPTVTVRYAKYGRMVDLTFAITGTSNADTLTFVLPFQPAHTLARCIGYGADDGTDLTTVVRVDISSSNTTATVYSSPQTGVWTASGTKTVQGGFTYEATT